MVWQYTHYVWPFVLSALICFGVMRYAWARRDVSASVPFMILAGLAGTWALLSALHVLLVGLPAKAFLSGLRYLAIDTLPVAWFAFALADSGRAHLLTPRTLGLLLAVPVVTLLLVVTNGHHGLMFSATLLVTEGPVSSVGRVYGPWFWVHMAYSYALMLAGGFIIFRHHLTGAALYRHQAWAMLAGVAVAFGLNIAFVAAPHRFAHIDWTPVAFAVSGLFFAWGLYRYHLLDLIPVAKAATIESLPDGVLVFDARGRVVDLNPAAQRILGLTESTALGKPFSELMPGALLPWPPEAGSALHHEIALPHGEERRVYEWHVTPLRTPHRAEQLQVGLLHDVTARKRAEVFEAGQKRILEHIAKGAPLPEVLTTLLLFTEELAATEMYCAVYLIDDARERLHCEAAPSLPSTFLETLGAMPVAPLAGSCGAAAYTGEPVQTDDVVTDPRWREYAPFALMHNLTACRSTPIHDPQGQVLGTLDAYTTHAALDDTPLLQMAAHLAGLAIQRNRFETHLIRSKEHAETMARLKSTFLANMSHEIRTPLTSIIGFADLLVGELDDEHKMLASRIEQGGKRLLTTLNSVLDYARLEAGKMEIRLQPLDVVEVAQETIAFFLPQTQAKAINLDLEVPDQAVTAHLDRGCLIRVLNNLVGNAIKFTDEGNIVLRVRTVDGAVEIQVEDTGCGIKADFLPHIFDEFQQESNGLARTHGGSGLGLRITKHLVEQMHGRIEAASRKGVGSTFTVTFPLPRAPIAAEPRGHRAGPTKARLPSAGSLPAA